MKRDNSRIACKLYKIGYNDTVQKLFLSLSHSNIYQVGNAQGKGKERCRGHHEKVQIEIPPPSSKFQICGEENNQN